MTNPTKKTSTQKIVNSSGAQTVVYGNFDAAHASSELTKRADAVQGARGEYQQAKQVSQRLLDTEMRV